MDFDSSKGIYFDLSSNGTFPGAIRNAYRGRLASPRTRHNQVPPLKPLKNVQTIDQRERMFLDAAGQGDRPTIQSFLECQDPINVNATDLLGRTALEIAVDNENVEIVGVLLKQPDIKIGNAMLHAIREGVYKIVEMLINHASITPEMLGEGWRDSLSKTDSEDFEYSADVSPVILAAHLNRFEILQLLLSRGAHIRRPHSLSCSCSDCKEERSDDSLQHSLRRIYTYRALASPAWMSLTSNDPILTAFRLSWELQKLSHKECEFKEVYWHLNEQCKSYACDLLTQCRSTEEVIAILNKDCMPDSHDDIWASKLSLDRLKLAIKYEQKQFVAHSHCQQLLTSIWSEGFPGRQERGSLVNKFICLLLIIIWPLMSIIYILFPRTRIGQVVRSPFMKFLYFSTSFGCFLCLLTLATFEDYRLLKGNPNGGRSDERGPVPTLIETLIGIWVFGMVWSEVKQLWNEGFKRYLRQWWNWLDYIMVSLYLCTFTLRVVAYFLIRDGVHGPVSKPRNQWEADEPMLISESLFAVANVFSFARIIYLFQTNPYLGPLQISLGCMLIDIGKFFVIFFLILTSFAIGLAQLYWYYTDNDCEHTVGCKGNSDAFSSIASSYTTLLWSLFSITKTEDTEVIENHDFTQLVGRGLYIAYHVASIIVLLNMLIAMMSHSFQTINDHADLEWKFHRTKLWMSYFDEGSSLPAPFNILLTPKSIWSMLKNIYCMIMCLFGRPYEWPTKNKRATIKRPGGGREKKTAADEETAEVLPKPPEPLTYQDIMRRLVSRYIHQTEKAMKMDGVNEDDLLEIKQDISSLRFELREDRRKEIARSSNHIDGVKHEILRNLSSAGPRPSFSTTTDETSCELFHEESFDENSYGTVRKSVTEPNWALATIRRRPQNKTINATYVAARDLERVKNEIVTELSSKIDVYFGDLIEKLQKIVE